MPAASENAAEAAAAEVANLDSDAGWREAAAELVASAREGGGTRSLVLLATRMARPEPDLARDAARRAWEPEPLLRMAGELATRAGVAAPLLALAMAAAARPRCWVGRAVERPGGVAAGPPGTGGGLGRRPAGLRRVAPCPHREVGRAGADR